MSKKKGAASSRNGRDSNAQRLGVKVCSGTEVARGHDHRAPAGHPVPPGRERRQGQRRHAVRHRDGTVQFGHRRGRKLVDIVPSAPE